MARFYGNVGFLIPVDDERTGMSTNRAVERPYYGTVIEHSRRWDTTEHVNDDLNISNQIEITANNYAFDNAGHITYVKYLGCYWKVNSIRIRGRKIIMSLGGVWNGPTATSAGAFEASAHGLVSKAGV